MNEELAKAYDHSQVETRWYQIWEQQGFFKPRHSEKGAFSIVMPPPNVTGALHMGHALDNTLQDVLVRWKRMQGFQTLWIPGTDHAGIATQNVVERQLQGEGSSRDQLGRDAFIDRVWRWKEQYGQRITQQLRHLGASPDWSHERFTMDDGCSEAVKENFITLYREGLIYKGNRIINWCPRCHTALSDVEVEYETSEGNLWQLVYPLKSDHSKGLVVATTRPETMFGDTAVAVHPDDARYKHLIGQSVVLPLANREIPIIADAYVDPAFGTGVVKITPAHDPNDFEVGLRHQLPQLMVMDHTAHMNDKVPPIYQGLDRYDCRKKVLEDLKLQGFLQETEKHEHNVGHCYRCQTVVEPYLSPQWFVKMQSLAEGAVTAVRSGLIKFVPARYEKFYFDWMENIRDWCISRQIWWGHRIPVYYCQACKHMTAAKSMPESCQACGGAKLEQDPDVLDTWFSSALWPFSTLGWPQQTDDLKTYYPTSVLVTGYDIITFWVSRMITMGLKQMQQPPFHTVYIHGLIRDEKGRKMSKSAGNAVDPLELIQENGADSLRFALCLLTTQGGQDIKLSPDRIQAARSFTNKLWNMSRFVLLSFDKLKEEQEMAPTTLGDRWIVSRLNHVIQNIDVQLTDYNFSRAAELLYEFTWNELCDWYIEMSKLNKEKATPVLLYVLDTTLRLLHPFMPFITEEIWQRLNKIPEKNGAPVTSLSLSHWPMADEAQINLEIEAQMKVLIDVITAIRTIRSELKVPLGKEAPVILVCANAETQRVLTEGTAYLQRLAKVSTVTIQAKIKEKPKTCGTAMAAGVEIYVPLDGLIDVQDELQRLEKEDTQLREQLERIKKKLGNQGFVDKAPPEVIDQEREKEKTYVAKRKVLQSQMASLKG